MAPQIIYIVLVSIVLLVHLSKDGQPIEREYSFFAKLVGTAIVVALLWWGGFWDVFIR